MINQITVSDIAHYLGIEDVSTQDAKLIPQMMQAANKYIESYTGLSADEINQREDLDIAYYVLVQDMYDNRTLYADTTNPNKTVETILNMHSVNLL